VSITALETRTGAGFPAPVQDTLGTSGGGYAQAALTIWPAGLFLLYVHEPEVL
jgi:hypothetical protein